MQIQQIIRHLSDVKSKVFSMQSNLPQFHQVLRHMQVSELQIIPLNMAVLSADCWGRLKRIGRKSIWNGNEI